MNLLAIFLRGPGLLLFLTIPLYDNAGAQAPLNSEVDLNEFIQELLPVMSEEGNPEELFEFFSQLLTDPFDINRVNENELASVILLSSAQINSFLHYRETAGPFLSLYELQAIPGWEVSVIKRISPFLTLKKQASRLTFKNPTQHFFVTRMRRVLERQKGFTVPEPGSRSVTRYAGNPWQWYARYRYARTGSFSMGLTLEKDAGEIWNWTPERQVYGIDFTSFHFQILNRGKLKNLIVGDYQVQAGQGLVLGSGFSLGKGSEVIRTTFRSSLGIRPYTSVMEQNYFRGAAATYEFTENWNVTVFHSYKRRDGTIAAKGSVFDSEVITSFPTDGYHRTPNERSKHGNILEKNTGGHLSYSPRKSSFQAGITALHTRYSLPVEKRNLPYNRYDFRGTTNTILGMHASYRTRNMHLFSESARSSSGGIGNVTGAIIALDKFWDISFLTRYYQRNFHTFYGNAFGESSRPFNEKGIYGGFRYSPSRKWQYSAFIDIFHFPWKRYLVDTTSRGNGFLVHTLWRPHKKFRSHAVIQSEQKQRNNRGEGVAPLPLITTRRTTALINLEWSNTTKYTFRTRLQGARYRFGTLPPSHGFTVVQDASLRLKRLELSGRIALFRTDNYDSRQYVFERDVLYSFSIPSYFNHGTRHYLMVRCDITRHLRLWIRWAQTRYSNIELIGSGLDEIIGKTRSEVKFQVMYRL